MKTVEEYRMDLHQIPELGRCEFETKKYLLAQLSSLSCQIFEPTETAVVAYFNADKEKTICFRADMDGLLMEEKTEVAYTSRHAHRMHACGHDGHMAMLLAIADWVSEHISRIQYNLVCLFQPSEEDHAGANDIIKSGILDTLQVEEVYGMHLWPSLEKGLVYSSPGSLLPASYEMDVEFIGKSVHAANRSDGIDALKIAAKWLLECYHLSSLIPDKHLLSFGSLEAPGPRNAVCGDAILHGTFRFFDSKTGDLMLEKINILNQRLELETKIKINFHVDKLYPVVVNNEKLFLKQQERLHIQSLSDEFWQAEDFGCYTQKYPCLFLLLGIGREHKLHTSDFNFDMRILSNGVEAYKKILKND